VETWSSLQVQHEEDTKTHIATRWSGCRPRPRVRGQRLEPCSRGWKNRGRSGSPPKKGMGADRATQDLAISPRRFPGSRERKRGMPRARWRTGRGRQMSRTRGGPQILHRGQRHEDGARSECRESRAGEARIKTERRRTFLITCWYVAGPKRSRSFIKRASSRAGYQRERRPRQEREGGADPIPPPCRRGAPRRLGRDQGLQTGSRPSSTSSLDPLGTERDFICSGDVRLSRCFQACRSDDDVAIGWKLRRKDLDKRRLAAKRPRRIGVNGGASGGITLVAGQETDMSGGRLFEQQIVRLPECGRQLTRAHSMARAGTADARSIAGLSRACTDGRL